MTEEEQLIAMVANQLAAHKAQLEETEARIGQTHQALSEMNLQAVALRGAIASTQNLLHEMEAISERTTRHC